MSTREQGALARPRYVTIAQDLFLSYLVALVTAAVVAARFWSLAPHWLVVISPSAVLLIFLIRLPTLLRQWRVMSSPDELTTQFRALPLLGPLLGTGCGVTSCVLLFYGSEADVLVLGAAMMIASMIGGLAFSALPSASLWITLASGLPIAVVAVAIGHETAGWLLAMNGAAVSFTLALSRRQKAQIDRLGRALAEAERSAEADAARLAAEKANASKSLFLAHVSHEIRTPLNGILGMAQVLSERELSAEDRGMVDTITESGTVLMTVLNDILDIAKIEAGKLEVTPSDGDLRNALKRVDRLFAPNAAQKGISLTLALDESLPPMLAFDPIRVRQVCANLLSNAIKFTEPGGSVTLAATWRPCAEGRGEVRVTVTDTGIGISEAAQAKLFSAFEQAEGTTSQRFGGTGLGLAISRRLAGLMNGTLTVDSAPGKGSVFSFVFAADCAADPDAASAGRAVPPPVVAGGTLHGKRVLLVDDNLVNRQVAGLLLSTLGVETVMACDGAEALQCLAAGPFDGVLLDIHMPVMDGPETLAAIRQSEAWRDLPVIALTADAMTDHRETYLGMGMDGFLSKPLVKSSLESELRAVLLGGGSGRRLSPVHPAAGRP